MFSKFILDILSKFFNLGKGKIEDSMVYSSGTTVSSANHASTMTLNIKTLEAIKDVSKNAKEIIENAEFNQDKIIEYFINQDVRIIKCNLAEKLLKPMYEHVGIVFPSKSFKSAYLDFIFHIFAKSNKQYSFSKDCLLIINEKPTDVYFLAYNLHKFLGYKKKISGYEPKAQEWFKKIYKMPTSKNIGSLKPKEALSIKEALSRDAESIDFAISMAKMTGTKEAGQELNQNGSTSA